MSGGGYKPDRSFSDDLSLMEIMDENHPNHEIFQTFMAFLGDYAMPIAATLAADAIEKIRGKGASEDDDTAQGGISGPLGVLMMALSKLTTQATELETVHANEDEKTSFELSLNGAGGIQNLRHFQQSVKESTYDKLVNSQIIIQNKRYTIFNKTFVTSRIDNKNDEANNALKKVFNSTIQFHVAKQTTATGATIEINYDKHEVLLEYFSGYWGVNPNTDNTYAKTKLKDAISDYLTSAINNFDIVENSLYPEHDAMSAELTKYFLRTKWKAIVSNAINDLSEREINAALKEVNAEIQSSMNDQVQLEVGINWEYTSTQPNIDKRFIDGAFTLKFAADRDEEIRNYADTISATLFDKAKKLLSDSPSETQKKLDTIFANTKTYVIYSNERFLKQVFRLVDKDRKNDVISGVFEATADDFHYELAEVTKRYKYNIHQLVPIFTTLMNKATRLNVFPTKEAWNDMLKFFEKIPEERKRPDQMESIQGLMRIIEEYSTKVQDVLIGPNSYDKDPNKRDQQHFLRMAFKKMCGDETIACDNDYEKTFVKFFMTVSCQDAFNQFLANQGLDDEARRRAQRESWWNWDNWVSSFWETTGKVLTMGAAMSAAGTLSAGAAFYKLKWGNDALMTAYQDDVKGTRAELDKLINEIQKIKEEALQEKTDLNAKHSDAMANLTEKHGVDIAHVKELHKSELELAAAKYSGRIRVLEAEAELKTSEIKRLHEKIAYRKAKDIARANDQLRHARSAMIRQPVEAHRAFLKAKQFTDATDWNIEVAAVAANVNDVKQIDSTGSESIRTSPHTNTSSFNQPQMPPDSTDESGDDEALFYIL